MTIASDALREVNAVRERFDMEPLPDLPKGISRSWFQCPITAALAECGVRIVLTSQAQFRNEDAAALSGWPPVLGKSSDCTKVPPAIARFIRSFDNGRQKRYERK